MRDLFETDLKMEECKNCFSLIRMEFHSHFTVIIRFNSPRGEEEQKV